MAIYGGRGATPLDQLASRLERDLVCPECGHEDSHGHWRARTTGSEVVYRHVCPGCGAVRDRVISLSN